MFSDNTFWQINIWGIIGVISGVLALIISLYNSLHLKSKIIITKLDLIIKSQIQINEWYGHRSPERMKDHTLDFNLKITLRNKGRNTTSIDKPALVITIGSEKKMIKIKPIRENAGPTDLSNPDLWKKQDFKKDAVWELRGGQILDDEITYVIDNLEYLYDIVDNYTGLMYSIEYVDNSGKKHTRPVTSVFVES